MEVVNIMNHPDENVENVNAFTTDSPEGRLRVEQEARLAAESRARMRDQFLSIVSHELRSPLNGIQSWAHVLESQLKDDNPMVQRALVGIKVGVQQQVLLIEDLLDASQLLTESLKIVKEPVILRRCINYVLESAAADISAKQISLFKQIEIERETIEGDVSRLQQILRNLLQNALKFTPEGGSIWFCASAADGHVEIVIRDNGHGIMPQHIDHLFDAFQHADSSKTRRNDGIGLGLTLAKQLTELQGGTLTGFSRGEDTGSTFSLRFPLLYPAEIPAINLNDTGQTLHGAYPSLSGLHVMLVDDQKEARNALAALLTLAGALISLAESGAEARNKLAKQTPDELPDVIVCDIAMPGEDGYETLKKIRDWENTQGKDFSRQIPAIALTAFTQKEDRIRSLAAGFHMHLNKPVIPSELIVRIAALAHL
jgi:CheY-like chemotaxis protein